MGRVLSRIGPWVPAVILGLLLGRGVAAGASQGATAKGRLAEAKAAAALWQKDALLVTLSALQAADDGTAPPNVGGWVYTFYSKKAKKWAGFHAGAKGLERVDLPAGLTVPLPSQFVDSDAVLTEVRKHGFQKSGSTLLSLMMQRDPSLGDGVYWCAAGEADLSVELGMRGYCVDPSTGKFVARMTGRAVQPPPAAKPPSAQGQTAGGGIEGLDPAQCGGFSPEDAAAILGIPSGSLRRRVERAKGGLWTCSFAAGDRGNQVLFTIAVAKSPVEAAAEMEKYRNRLGDNYTDLMGLGDEGVWTEVNRTVTYRKQNVTVQVQQPPDKIQQLRVVQAFFGRN